MSARNAQVDAPPSSSLGLATAWTATAWPLPLRLRHLRLRHPRPLPITPPTSALDSSNELICTQGLLRAKLKGAGSLLAHCSLIARSLLANFLLGANALQRDRAALSHTRARTPGLATICVPREPPGAAAVASVCMARVAPGTGQPTHPPYTHRAAHPPSIHSRHVRATTTLQTKTDLFASARRARAREQTASSS